MSKWQMIEPNHCPRCGDSDITYTGSFNDATAKSIPVGCNKCEATWMEVWRFDTYIMDKGYADNHAHVCPVDIACDCGASHHFRERRGK